MMLGLRALLHFLNKDLESVPGKSTSSHCADNRKQKLISHCSQIPILCNDSGDEDKNTLEGINDSAEARKRCQAEEYRSKTRCFVQQFPFWRKPKLRKSQDDQVNEAPPSPSI